MPASYFVDNKIRQTDARATTKKHNITQSGTIGLKYVHTIIETR
jgi:hypothetical protein